MKHLDQAPSRDPLSFSLDLLNDQLTFAQARYHTIKISTFAVPHKTGNSPGETLEKDTFHNIRVFFESTTKWKLFQTMEEVGL
jgi:hypothetical protein